VLDHTVCVTEVQPIDLTITSKRPLLAFPETGLILSRNRIATPRKAAETLRRELANQAEYRALEY
jgi:hypothetical protein